MPSLRAQISLNCTILALLLLWTQIAQESYPTDELKYILLWTNRNSESFSFLEDGQNSFITRNCAYVNCYVTSDKSFFGTNYSDFHAIAFNGRDMKPFNRPRIRYRHQKYIYFNMESSDSFPVCHWRYDDFFNLTATFKLDSDIPLPYILIKNMKGEVVGPKPIMQWNEVFSGKNKSGFVIVNKTKAVAWWPSQCKSRSKNQEFVKKLHAALSPYSLMVDTYGSCGTLKLIDNNWEVLLKTTYFFYLALENSSAEDYVTEKLLTALQNDVIPIVFGGANYSRFLPPGSYIDSKKHTIEQLAAIMNGLTQSPEDYREYFRWKEKYTYHDPTTAENLCRICQALNDKHLMEHTTYYPNFRKWWNPNYEKLCSVT